MPSSLQIAGIQAVVFDMDGTLADSPLDFDAICVECGLAPGRPLLEKIAALDGAARQRAEEVLARHERRAALECTLFDGAAEVLAELRRRGFRLGLITRNSAESVRTVLARFGLEFDCWLSREDAAPKPSPEPVLRAAERLGVAPENTLVVGDYSFDMQAGRAAGAVTAFLRRRRDLEPPADADVVIDELGELLELLVSSPWSLVSGL